MVVPVVSASGGDEYGLLTSTWLDWKGRGEMSASRCKSGELRGPRKYANGVLRIISSQRGYVYYCSCKALKLDGGGAVMSSQKFRDFEGKF